METHEELLSWAEAQGIEMNGIRPDRIPDRGIGIITTRKVKADETILKVPTKALRTVFTVPKVISKKLPANMSVHGLLAADLALDQSGKFDEWDAVVPSVEDLQTVPFTWPPALQELLPTRAKDLLKKQEVKFGKDWAAVSAAFPSLSEDNYRHAWLLANTRTFYYVCPRTEKFAREDRMVLQPVADLFNHADKGCSVAFSEDDFTIKSDRDYGPGEELLICYGNHSNDFLLAEYGFVLSSSDEEEEDGGNNGIISGNRFDECCIDDAVMPRLSASQRRLLEDHNFLGNYMLDAERVCFRTEAAVRLLSSPSESAWLDFIEGLDSGGTGKAQEEKRQQARADHMLRELLQKYQRKTVHRILAELEEDDDKKRKTRTAVKEKREEELGTKNQRALLQTRWKQIDGLLAAAIARLAD